MCLAAMAAACWSGALAMGPTASTATPTLPAPPTPSTATHLQSLGLLGQRVGVIDPQQSTIGDEAQPAEFGLRAAITQVIIQLR